jgi:hypothetical protein
VLTQVVGLADGADGTVCAGEGYGTGGARRGGGGIFTVYTIVLIISRDMYETYVPRRSSLQQVLPHTMAGRQRYATMHFTGIMVPTDRHVAGGTPLA